MAIERKDFTVISLLNELVEYYSANYGYLNESLKGDLSLLYGMKMKAGTEKEATIHELKCVAYTPFYDSTWDIRVSFGDSDKIYSIFLYYHSVSEMEMRKLIMKCGSIDDIRILDRKGNIIMD